MAVSRSSSNVPPPGSFACIDASTRERCSMAVVQAITWIDGSGHERHNGRGGEAGRRGRGGGGRGRGSLRERRTWPVTSHPVAGRRFTLFFSQTARPTERNANACTEFLIRLAFHARASSARIYTRDLCLEASKAGGPFRAGGRDERPRSKMAPPVHRIPPERAAFSAVGIEG